MLLMSTVVQQILLLLWAKNSRRALWPFGCWYVFCLLFVYWSSVKFSDRIFEL